MHFGCYSLLSSLLVSAQAYFESVLRKRVVYYISKLVFLLVEVTVGNPYLLA